ncbi:hypothetical protein BWI97_25955, partial [Siphonobacter sp. BAB-5405]|uniref:sensor histidine kinase n=1 Tax=Siphonobacter sp. BAB-5405 TaxID=1864825 RepID=UPI000CB92220
MIFKQKAEALHLEYTIDVPQQNISLYIDRAKLESVVVNLLSNAFKYSSAGGSVQIRVTVVGSSDSSAVYEQQHLTNHYLQLAIQDHGVGMDTAEMNRIFDPYYQATHTESMQVMGTGIGLSLVKTYVDAHQGEVLVTSQPGAGTTFLLRLPFGTTHLDANTLHRMTVGDEPMPVAATLSAPTA